MTERAGHRAPFRRLSGCDARSRSPRRGHRRPVDHTDTVDRAAATPDQPQPYRELGLRDDEYARIREILGRRPTDAELAMYSVMWSEHCSYKSSKVHLALLR